jgi:hypothetical protein
MTRWDKIRTVGLWPLLARRCRWYKRRFQRDNWMIGRLVELCGNRVRICGLHFSVDSELITTQEKSTLYFGLYEREETDLVRSYLPRDEPVIELGGSIGVVSCLTNKLLECPEDHVVVEANPVLIPTLERNREQNGCRFAIEPAAAAYGTERVDFGVTDCFITGSVGGGSC